MKYPRQLIARKSGSSLGGLGWPSGQVYLTCTVTAGLKAAVGRNVQVVLEAEEFDDFVRAVEQMRAERENTTSRRKHG